MSWGPSACCQAPSVSVPGDGSIGWLHVFTQYCPDIGAFEAGVSWARRMGGLTFSFIYQTALYGIVHRFLPREAFNYKTQPTSYSPPGVSPAMLECPYGMYTGQLSIVVSAKCHYGQTLLIRVSHRSLLGLAEKELLQCVSVGPLSAMSRDSCRYSTPQGPKGSINLQSMLTDNRQMPNKPMAGTSTLDSYDCDQWVIEGRVHWPASSLYTRTETLPLESTRGSIAKHASEGRTTPLIEPATLATDS